ncbi:hypothetical protein N7509_002811 [Penicillium cosmopolitanum]|uniref:Uncharacterized protein n=1 Tax=Penicillium cosmopolitanum TaxID=1131564 RepID=A0A9X0BDP1_9EURO|nr:uncharacterized protein N7509_002811 [Penicillium cosmopolitanum]KAJ5408928.1 hypothetical protein N7509_002811 [Penicillium cosmopolitanum]
MEKATTSEQWLITLNTSIFWPTATNYYYGPTTGPKASAVSCNAEWVEYAGRSEGLRSLGPTATSISLGSYGTSEGACRTFVSPEAWSDTHTGPLTTLCDGIPRALGPRETATQYYPGTGPCITGYTTYTNTETLYREPSPVPDCALETSDCIPIWQTYSSLSSSWEDSIITSMPGDTNSPIRPADCPQTNREYPEANPCSNCHFLPDSATLFYWPISTADGDLCLQNGTTVPASGLSTAVVNGATFTSPSIYVSFTSIYAWSNRRGHAGFQCGVDHSDVVISVNPETVSSVRNHRNAKYPTIGTAYPFNFAEFTAQEVGNYTQSLIPWPQFRGGQQCPLGDSNTCSMIRDDYSPWLLLPEEIRGVDPGWTVCDNDWYIPPVTMVALDRETITVTSTPEPTAELFAAAVAKNALAASTPQATTRGW